MISTLKDTLTVGMCKDNIYTGVLVYTCFLYIVHAYNCLSGFICYVKEQY